MRFEIILSNEHLRPYRWRLVTDDRRINAAGPACADLAAAREGINLVQSAAVDCEIRDLTANPVSDPAA